MQRNRLVALLLGLMVIGSGAALFAQTEFQRPVNYDPAGLTADRPNDGNEPVPLPVPVAPPNNSKGRNPLPTLEVAVPATVDLLNFVVCPVGGDEPVANGYTTQRRWPVQLLQGDVLPAGFYTWTCRARHGGNWSDFFSPVWYFEVEKVGPDNPLDDIGKSRQLPPAPIPMSPLPRARVRNGQITLAVEPGIDVEEYHFRVTSGNSGHGTWDGFTSQPEWRVPRFPVNLTGIFNWTCRAKLGGLWSDWFRPDWFFEIENPSTQPNGGELGGNIGPVSSVAVSPNPTRAGTQVRLALARRCNVTAALYDAQGALVRTLNAGPLAAGSHNLFWNGRDDFGRRVGAGTYLCRITADDASGVVRITISR